MRNVSYHNTTINSFSIKKTKKNHLNFATCQSYIGGHLLAFHVENVLWRYKNEAELPLQYAITFVELNMI